MTEFEKTQLVKQHEQLINKLTKQYVDKVHAPWNEIKSMAYEGFAIALETYDPERSQMNFTQYAGFSIRNNILTSLDNELRIVKLSAYAQKKATENGESLFNCVSIEGDWCKDNDNGRTGQSKTKDWSSLAQEEKFSDGDIFQTLYTKLESNFPARDCEIFYRTFGLKDYDETKGKDIAVYFNISPSLVSMKVKAIINYIQHDTELIEVLSNLLK